MTNEELKIDALKDTYYEAGYGADYILEMLVLVRGEEFCREHFPEFYDEEEEEDEKEKCEYCCLTECACSVCECCSSFRWHYEEMCGDCGKCNGIDKGSNDFNAKCCECDIPDETVFKCFECSVEIKRNSREHDNCKTANGVDWYCEDCDIPDEDDEEDETVE